MTLKEFDSQNKSKDEETKISHICDTFCEDLTSYFKDIRKKISENLLKLRLGVIEQTVDNVMDSFFKEGIKDLNESLKGKLVSFSKDFYKQ